jgi:hypothetical protein
VTRFPVVFSTSVTIVTDTKVITVHLYCTTKTLQIKYWIFPVYFTWDPGMCLTISGAIKHKKFENRCSKNSLQWWGSSYKQLHIAERGEFLMAPSAKILRHTIEHWNDELWREETIRKSALFFHYFCCFLFWSSPLSSKRIAVISQLTLRLSGGPISM